MILVIHDGDKINYIQNIGLDFTKENICVVNKLPQPEEREGYDAILKYDENKGLVYDYIKK